MVAVADAAGARVGFRFGSSRVLHAGSRRKSDAEEVRWARHAGNGRRRDVAVLGGGGGEDVAAVADAWRSRRPGRFARPRGDGGGNLNHRRDDVQNTHGDGDEREGRRGWKSPPKPARATRRTTGRRAATGSCERGAVKGAVQGAGTLFTRGSAHTATTICTRTELSLATGMDSLLQTAYTLLARLSSSPRVPRYDSPRHRLALAPPRKATTILSGFKACFSPAACSSAVRRRRTRRSRVLRTPQPRATSARRRRRRRPEEAP